MYKGSDANEEEMVTDRYTLWKHGVYFLDVTYIRIRNSCCSRT